MERRTITHCHQGIRIDKIPSSGLAGLLFTVACFLLFLSIPAIREFLLIGLIGGVPTAGLLYFWHNQTRW